MYGKPCRNSLSYANLDLGDRFKGRAALDVVPDRLGADALDPNPRAPRLEPPASTIKPRGVHRHRRGAQSACSVALGNSANRCERYVCGSTPLALAVSMGEYSPCAGRSAGDCLAEEPVSSDAKRPNRVLHALRIERDFRMNCELAWGAAV